MMSMKYQYQEFVNRRDLEGIIRNSIPVLEAHGIDPVAFYNTIIENPEVLKNEETLNELLGWARDAASALGAGAQQAYAGDQARWTRQDLDAIRKMSPEQQAQYGFTPEKIKGIEDQQKAQSAQYGRGFWGSVADKWKSARSDREGQALQARYGGMSQKYAGTPNGTVAPSQPASPATPATPPAPATPAPVTPSNGPASTNNTVGGNTISTLANQLQSSEGFDDTAKTQLIKMLDQFMAGLKTPAAPATPPPAPPAPAKSPRTKKTTP